MEKIQDLKIIIPKIIKPIGVKIVSLIEKPNFKSEINFTKIIKIAIFQNFKNGNIKNKI